MLKEFRSLMQMLDGLDDAASPSEDVAPDAVELPQSLDPAVEAGAPSSFVFDTEAAHATSLSTILKASGVETETFEEAAGFVRGLLTRTPAMVFLEVAKQPEAAIDALFAMGEHKFSGGVQLMRAELDPIVDIVRHVGHCHALEMLPPVKKPLETATVLQVLSSRNLNLALSASASLGEALTQGLVEFWYQPKIDLARRAIAGVETFARVRHPELGTLPPGVFMRGATEADLARLTEKALSAALKAAGHFARVGINLRVAVNVPVEALFELPIAKMVEELGPNTPRWPGLLLDITASQLAADFARVQAIGPDLAAHNIHLAVDDFGRGSLSIAALSQLPVAELKLDRAFVNGCADDPAHAKVCASVIDLAHHLGCVAVAVGIERSADMRALATMGCDVGQGFLFGQPMPQGDLVDMLLRRILAKPASAPASDAQPAAAQPAPEPVRTAAPRSSLKRAVWN